MEMPIGCSYTHLPCGVYWQTVCAAFWLCCDVPSLVLRAHDDVIHRDRQRGDAPRCQLPVSSSSHGWEGMSQLHSKICHLHVAIVNRMVQSLLSLHGRGSQLMTWLFWTRQIWYATITLGFVNVKGLRAPGKTPAGGILITATRDHFMWHKRRASIWIGILWSWALITMRYGVACHEWAPTEDS